MRIKSLNKLKYLSNAFLLIIFGGWIYFVVSSDFLTSIIFAAMMGPAVVSRIVIENEF